MLKLSKGNSKLVNTDKVRFLIWNLPAIATCPYSTEMCRKYCYARKAERLYPAVLPARMGNLESAQRDDFVLEMISTIQAEVTKKSYLGKTVLFRVHESGDFYSREYTKKWLSIVNVFPNIQFLAYTKSLVFFQDLELPPNFTLRASIWADTATSELQRIVDGKLPTYTALPKEEITSCGAILCDCGRGCANCKLCWNKDALHIATAIH